MTEQQSLTQALALEGLTATGPSLELAGKMDLFGQFVGSWEATGASYNEDGSFQQSMQGEIHFGWILEGRAVQDVWIFPTLAERREKGLPVDEYGSTIRFYDSNMDAWRVIWISPVNRNVRVFTARPVGDEIVIEGLNTQGQAVRWIFSNITQQSFHWRHVLWIEGEQKWHLVEEIEVHRLK
ncbi:MAG TPA: hypothetical protein VH186_19390 [Chloroflexia bacterium]|nr:hypothetical protein [Chloroflexia bacterium]